VDPAKSHYIVDDSGQRGGLAAGSDFAVLGDLNADPLDGDSYPGTIDQLLKHPAIDASTIPASAGAATASRQQGKRNLRHRGDASHDTSDFGDDGSGNLRIDYVLPSRNLRTVDAGVFWPTPGDPGFQAAVDASDHRLVWIDLSRN
jgi:3-phytase